jgi:hypothetical protein
MGTHRLVLGSALLVTALAAMAACSGSTAGNGAGSDGGNPDGAGSSSGGGDSASDPFVGSWVCTGTSSLTFTQPAGHKPETDSFTTDVTIVANGDGSETITGQAVDGGPTCVTKATVSGNTATLESGQSCQNANGTTTAYTGGTATLTSSTTYTVTRTFSFSGTVTVTPDGGSPEQVQVAGSGTSTGTCTKQ